MWLKAGRRRPCSARRREKPRENGGMFCPQACYKHKCKQNKHKYATVQVNNQTTACTPRGKGRQEKVTAGEEKEEEKTKGKTEAKREKIKSLNDVR